mgnify:CR=1 FL=1
MSSISVKNVYKNFGPSEQVLTDMNIEIEDGSFTVLLGPSGCGKSTLLRLIAGLDKPSAGKILRDGVDITDAEPKDRKLAMVFQNYALYPHMTVYQNVEYGLKIAKIPNEERKKLVFDALEMVELTDQMKKLPAQMSGGQRQRAALARAIVKKPSVFLMDEPLSNLDAKLRVQMRDSISDLYRRIGTTFLYVTHDQVEAMSMGTKIAILNQGNIMQEGTPKEIYTNPQNLFVAGFIGSPPCNIIDLKIGSAAIRCENILTGGQAEGITIRAAVQSVEQLGQDSVYALRTPAGILRVKAPCTWEQYPGEMEITLPVDQIQFFDEKGDRTSCNEQWVARLSEVLGAKDGQ